jgi:hypothetical protein
MENRTIESKPPVKLALCIPSQGEWKADFGMCFVQMCLQMACNPFEEGQDRNVIVLDKRTSLLPRSRQECLEDAILQDCTHAFFMDTDQSFPADIAHKFMAWKKPVVAANVALKIMPSFPTARNRGPTAFGVPVTSDNDKHGLEKVWRVGAGLMLIDLSILKNVPKPWFEIHYSAKNAQFVGEDWFFIGKLEAAGYDVYIDHDISRQVGHVGNFCYMHINIPSLQMQAAA